MDDLWRWLRIGVCGLSLRFGLLGWPGKIASAAIRFVLVYRGAECLSDEHKAFLEEQRFEHEKLLREMDERLRQPQDEREIEMLHELEDFWSAKPDV